MLVKRPSALPTATEDATLAPRSWDDAKYAAALGALWGKLDSHDSQRAYKDDWRRYCEWLKGAGIDPRAADAAVVQDYVNHLRDGGKARATRARALSVVREVYRAFVVAGIVASNPAREVKNPKIDATPRTPWLEEEQVRAFFSAAPAVTWKERRDLLAFRVLVLVGMRRSEVARIAIDDFSANYSTLRAIVKGNKERIFGIPIYLIGEIKTWLDFAKIESGPLFPREPGSMTPVSGKMLYDAVVAAGRLVGIHAPPHAFRRTLITIAIRRGVPMRDLQHAVGHESVTTTERYEKAARAATLTPGDALVDLVRGSPPSGVNDE